MTEPPLSSSSPPIRPSPTVPPDKPSDQVGALWAQGTITRGGTGPCYGFTTDEGAEYALYSEAGLDLAEGEELRVRLAPAAFTADCGDGQLMRLLEVDRG